MSKINLNEFAADEPTEKSSALTAEELDVVAGGAGALGGASRGRYQLRLAEASTLLQKD
jgi:hypothetical protein